MFTGLQTKKSTFFGKHSTLGSLIHMSKKAVNAKDVCTKLFGSYLFPISRRREIKRQSAPGLAGILAFVNSLLHIGSSSSCRNSFPGTEFVSSSPGLASSDLWLLLLQLQTDNSRPTLSQLTEPPLINLFYEAQKSSIVGFL